MERKSMRTSALARIAVVVMLVAAWEAKAQDTKKPYPSMAPLEQYLMPDRSEEIKLARSAAPDSISGDAGVLILGRHGYQTAIKSQNGFGCVVETSSRFPLHF